jgi:hypothetical protein
MAEVPPRIRGRAEVSVRYILEMKFVYTKSSAAGLPYQERNSSYGSVEGLAAVVEMGDYTSSLGSGL